MSEWFKELVLKTSDSERDRGFESHLLRHFYGGIAQLGEHLPYKQGVIGSIPVAPTIFGPVVQLV